MSSTVSGSMLILMLGACLQFSPSSALRYKGASAAPFRAVPATVNAVERRWHVAMRRGRAGRQTTVLIEGRVGVERRARRVANRGPAAAEERGQRRRKPNKSNRTRQNGKHHGGGAKQAPEVHRQVQGRKYGSSCFGRCGGEYNSANSCQCNAECYLWKNCCWNYQNRCSKKYPENDDTYRVLSYNICWGCMEGDPDDKTAMKKDLKKVCTQYTTSLGVRGENGMGLNVTRCAENMGEAIAQYHTEAGGYDLMAFQEASNFGNLKLGRRGVQMEKVQFGAQLDMKHIKGIHTGQLKKAWVVSMYDPYRMGIHNKVVTGVLQSDSGRPYLMLIFDWKKLIFINIHNTHRGNFFLKRRSWKNFPEEMGASLEPAFTEKARRRNYRVILAGDLNDLDGKLPGSLVLPWNGAKLHLQQSPARTCCNTKVKDSAQLKFGDYIFDTKYMARNRVPSIHDLSKAQSDHLPVEAELGP